MTGKCENCKYCKEYKIHKRILGYSYPCKEASIFPKPDKTRFVVTVSRDFSEFEPVDICERLKCECAEDGWCELWEDKE